HSTGLLRRYLVARDGLGPVYSHGELVFRTVRYVVRADLAALANRGAAFSESSDAECAMWLPHMRTVAKYVEVELARIDQIWTPYAALRGPRQTKMAEAHIALRYLWDPELAEFLACGARAPESESVRTACSRIIAVLAIEVDDNGATSGTPPSSPAANDHEELSRDGQS